MSIYETAEFQGRSAERITLITRKYARGLTANETRRLDSLTRELRDMERPEIQEPIARLTELRSPSRTPGRVG